MSIKLYVSNQQEYDVLVDALSLLDECRDEAVGREILDNEQETKVNAFLNNVEVVIGAAELDTALMGEIGKAYRDKYNEAKQAGETETEHKMYGAMFAIKRVMDMVKDPVV